MSEESTAQPAPLFKEGDIVKLKSGGPPMTLCTYQGFIKPNAITWVHCWWFDCASVEKGDFPESSLVAV